MKNSLLPALVLGALFFVQPADAQVRFGVKAGVNASNVKFQRDPDFDPLPGYQGGLQAEISLSPNFSVQPALLYVTKGFSSMLEFRNQQGTLTGNFRGTFRPNYLELPVLVLYKSQVSNTCKIFGGLGPYTAAGLGGKSSFNTQSVGFNQKILFGPKKNRPEGTYNRMDHGLVAAAGVEVGRISLAVNYSHGLTGIAPVDHRADVISFYNRSLGLTAGYWFGKARI
ncbi:porin family protein [Persicitalea jodogahamensis]|uniref:Outer membrane protein beta-barrel domain-containing protein n=1 Tax=Persicitalea jodogahamensis TaxID=402147 RepID=A0A8J3D2H3_9BACT|nr:porin family protein [Persicitalea jodogahamensis]GHB58482.1 hypothetical protein GCM10007390_09960 [Persicitalea jodogahamensis]